MNKINKILIANRGEIAIRIMRTCREMGIHTVAVYSDADRMSLHVRYAQEAYYIGKAPASESYLDIEKMIQTAKQCKADAIHPGYGFLSENAAFSRRCQEEGIIFIGASPEAIETMGDKITARETMIKAGIPVVPGTQKYVVTEEEALEVIDRVGLPVMIKASAGGGGKGMRLVTARDKILQGLRAARSEAKEAFGDDSVYIEKYISSPHHIEIQILADSYGNTIQLFERECSIQRRHQKMVEETPSPFISDTLREKMGTCAVQAARAVNYEGAGTIEFLVDENHNFYFLEMNTRLQVEHPITERVTGIDLVKQQIRVARGNKLTLRQEDLTQNGSAIECRIYAEDSDNNFMPSPGKVSKITQPMGLGVRSDGYVYEGYEIPVHYDPLISKLIVWGETRAEAIARMQRALYEYKIIGVKTSIKFLEKIMRCKDFIRGTYDTHFIENNRSVLLADEKINRKVEDIVMMATYIDYLNKLHKIYNAKEFTPVQSRWKKANYLNHF